jgi:hypothetical protein
VLWKKSQCVHKLFLSSRAPASKIPNIMGRSGRWGRASVSVPVSAKIWTDAVGSGCFGLPVRSSTYLIAHDLLQHLVTMLRTVSSAFRPNISVPLL